MLKKVLEYITNSCYHIIKIGKLMSGGYMNKGYSALDIATWFIYKNNAEKKETQAVNDCYEVYEDLTHLKLQKLLYFAQGINLSRNNEPLFSEDIEAREHGPVVKKVFEKLKGKKREELELSDAPSGVDSVRKIESDSKVREILIMTYDNFAIYTAWQLRNMTHEVGTPWYQTYVPGKNKKISLNLIKKYFDKEVME